MAQLLGKFSFDCMVITLESIILGIAEYVGLVGLYQRGPSLNLKIHEWTRQQCLPVFECGSKESVSKELL